MERVVIDTNVFVAAGFNARSASARIVAAIRERRFRLVWNEPTRRETEFVLRRIPLLGWDKFADLFRPEGEFNDRVDPHGFDFIEDPDDRKFAALGAAAKVPLVTNDHDLLAHRNLIGFDVLTPRAFLARAGQTAPSAPFPADGDTATVSPGSDPKQPFAAHETTTGGAGYPRLPRRRRLDLS